MTVAVARERSGFLYDQVCDYITQLVGEGQLKPGDRAPSLRKLSKQLGVSISTVTQAYFALEQQGYLKARPQSGYFISAPQQLAAETPKRTVCRSCQPRKVKYDQLFEDIFQMANDPDVVPFGAARPSMELMPASSLVRATNRMASADPHASMDYCFPPGHKRLRRQIAMHYAELGMQVSSDEVVITSGATEALSLSLQSVAKRGDVIAVETPTYFAVLRVIERMGLMALEIDTDPQSGMVLESLEDALETMNISAVLTVPNFSNPMGSLMPDEKKRELVQLLAQHEVPLIEDDVYGSLYFGEQRPKVAKSYDEDGWVLSCSSFSKTIAPGYRVGWVLPGRYHETLLEWKQATFSATASLPQRAMAEFLASGQYERHLQRLRKAFREQVERGRFLFARHFPEGTRITQPQGGFVLWIELPRGVSGLDVFEQALEQGIGITPGILFSATRRYRNFIRINCGFPWQEHNEQAVQRLGEIVQGLMA